MYVQTYKTGTGCASVRAIFMVASGCVVIVEYFRIDNLSAVIVGRTAQFFVMVNKNSIRRVISGKFRLNFAGIIFLFVSSLLLFSS